MVTKKAKPRMGKPRGTRNGYNKVLRRQGDIGRQREIRFRFSSSQERGFVEEAAMSLKESNSQFSATAALERAEKVLSRSRPASVIPPEPSSASLPA
jgi:hypothetical protein